MTPHSLFPPFSLGVIARVAVIVSRLVWVSCFCYPFSPFFHPFTSDLYLLFFNATPGGRRAYCFLGVFWTIFFVFPCPGRYGHAFVFLAGWPFGVWKSVYCFWIFFARGFSVFFSVMGAGGASTLRCFNLNVLPKPAPPLPPPYRPIFFSFRVSLLVRKPPCCCGRFFPFY